jgi:hypothetical protein
MGVMTRTNRLDKASGSMAGPRFSTQSGSPSLGVRKWLGRYPTETAAATTSLSPFLGVLMEEIGGEKAVRPIKGAFGLIRVEKSFYPPG